MEIKIKYEDLIARCEQLSSFESEGKVDATGQSRYLEIHINEADKLLIQQYIAQARGILEERMERMISRVDDIYPTLHPFDGILHTPTLVEMFNDGEMESDPIMFVDQYFTDEGGETLYKFVHVHRAAGDGWNFGYPVPDEYDWNKSPDSVFYDGKLYYRWNQDGTNIVDFIPDLPSQGLSWTLRTDARWKQNSTFTKHITEAIVAYTMSAWLSDKLPERVAFYDTLFSASTEMAVKNIFKKQAPRYEE
jgi:hypothetical protein